MSKPVKLLLLALLVLVPAGVGLLMDHSLAFRFAVLWLLGLIVAISIWNRQSTLSALHQVQETLISGRELQQVQALMHLHELLPFRHPLPRTGLSAGSADLLSVIASIVLERKPQVIVEAGSGVSTLITAYALEKSGSGRLVSLDHEEVYAAVTRQNLATHQVGQYAEVRSAPLTPQKTATGEELVWYDASVLHDVDSIDLLTIDGPPNMDQSGARYPALPLLWDKLAPNAVIIVDDCEREDDLQTVARWEKEFGPFERRDLDTEKGTVILFRKG